MAMTVSPYLSSPPVSPVKNDSGADAGPANTTAPQTQNNPAPADQISLSSQAQQSLAGDGKTPLQSTLEMILDGVKNASGPTLSFFRASLPGQTGTKFDQSC